jgi:hypothetical protein
MGFVSCQSKLAEYLLSEWPLLPSGGRKRRERGQEVAGVEVRGLQIDQPNVLSVEVIVCTTTKKGIASAYRTTPENCLSC